MNYKHSKSTKQSRYPPIATPLLSYYYYRLLRQMAAQTKIQLYTQNTKIH